MMQRAIFLRTSDPTTLRRLYSTKNYAAFMLSHIERHAMAHPKNVAIIDGVTKRETLYKDLPYRIGAAARGFQALGVKRGSVVGLHLPNSPEFIVAWNALASLGAIVTTSNPAYSPSELTHQFKDSGAELVVVHPALDAIARAGGAGAGLKDSAILNLDSPSLAFLTQDVTLQGASRVAPSVVEVDGPTTHFALPYSSGTTGLAKGVRLSHANLIANLEQCSTNLAIDAKDTVLGVLPFYHIYGITCLMGVTLMGGGKLVTLPKFDPALFLTSIQQQRCTYVFAVPPIIAFLAKHPVVSNFDLSSMHTLFSGAAPLDGETQQAVEKRFPGVVVRQGYGMTETSPITHAEPSTGRKPGSVGTPLPDTQCRIVDPTSGASLPAGKANVGELQVKGPQVMMGYHNNPKATAETILPGGWLRTGDLAYADQDGYYFVVDRLKELIKVKGLQVAPAELEGLLLQHPLVYDAAVVGRADERAGEVPVAFIVTKAAMLKGMGNAAGAAALPEVTPEGIKGFMAGKVAEYKTL